MAPLVTTAPFAAAEDPRGMADLKWDCHRQHWKRQVAAALVDADSAAPPIPQFPAGQVRPADAI